MIPESSKPIELTPMVRAHNDQIFHTPNSRTLNTDEVVGISRSPGNLNKSVQINPGNTGAILPSYKS